MNDIAIGTRVRATQTVTDSGDPNDQWVHAREGDEGTVVYRDDDFDPEYADNTFTVTFDRTGTTTDTSLAEVEVVEDEDDGDSEEVAFILLVA